MICWTDEAEAGFPYWWHALDTGFHSDDLPDRCDLLVIGGGYCGLSSAIAAHDCGARVVVVDAQTPGHGASTRNGGMFGAHPRLSWDVLHKRFGAEVADAIFTEAHPALNWAQGLIRDEKIACDYQSTGRIQLSWTRSHFDAQRKLAETVRAKSEVRAEVVERAELNKEIATEQYFGGVVFPEHGAIQPAKFHQGLLEAVRRRGIFVCSEAEVQSLGRDGTAFVAHTPKGQIRAQKVVLATNGYTSANFRWHVRRVFPLPSFLIATEELPAELINRLAPGRRMMVETRARHSYFRISPDGRRIIYGGRASMRPIPLALAASRLHDTMCSVWPELHQVRLSHVWWGNTGYSFAHMPHVGADRGLHFAMGFSGSGTVMAPYLGAKAAWAAVGDARGETAYSQTHLPRHWLHPGGTPHFLKAADLWYRHWVDRVENIRSR